MKLKSNTINTNLRDHGFAIAECPNGAILEEFGTLPDLKNWSKRYNTRGLWSKDITDSVADSFRFSIGSTRPQLALIPAPISRSLLPARLSSLIGNSEELHHEILVTMRAVRESMDWKTQFLERITAEWLRLSETFTPIEHSVFIRAIFKAAIPPISVDPILEINLRFLLNAQSNASQASDGIAFLDFLRLTLRFGLPSAILNHVREVSSPTNTFFTRGSSFAAWFFPSVDRNAVAFLFANGAKWIVRFSKEPNCFTIEVRDEERVIATHVKMDALASNPGTRLTVEFEGGVIHGAQSWVQLLTEVLELEIPQGSLFLKPKTLTFVDARTIAQHQRTTREVVDFLLPQGENNDEWSDEGPPSVE
jgi:hypothetical protein